MNKNNYYLAVALVGLLVTTAGVTAIASADEGAGELKGRWFGHEKQEDREMKRAEMDQIFENKDYEAWKKMMDIRPLDNVDLSEETFAKMSEMHELMQAGDISGAQAIAEELGLPNKGPRGEKGKNGQFNNPEVLVAIESGDYNAWKELMGDRPIAEKINADNFAQFVEMHNLMKSGDKEAADAIRSELGLEKNGMGFKRAFNEGKRVGEKNCQKNQ